MKTIVALSILSAGCHAANVPDSHRQLEELPLFFSYEPRTSVVDHSAIDKDQKEIEIEVARGSVIGFNSARRVYTEGGHSRSYAVISLIDPVDRDYSYDTPISGYNSMGEEVTGVLEKDIQAGSDIIWFLYDVENSLENHVGCQVGGSGSPILDGCLENEGEIVLADGLALNYTYNPMTDNRNGRRFDKFSTEAREKLYTCDHCPYADYDKFFNYFGTHDYADQWIRSAFDGLETNYKFGNADFSRLSRDGRAQAIQTATVSMSLWMYVIREMEYALDNCSENCRGGGCTDDKVHGWDQAVALYTGSEAQSSGGYLLYTLADRMCTHFNTCGFDGAQSTGTALVNFQIFKEFEAGQKNILQGRCSEARENKEKIVKLMTVPLVQATLRSAHNMDFPSDTSEQDEAEGATFATSLLPIIQNCDQMDGEELYLFMRIGHGSNGGFELVKDTLERNYGCMGITCEDVGGLVDQLSGVYHRGAQPCKGVPSSRSSKGRINNIRREPKGSNSVGLGVGITVGILAVAALVSVLVMKRSNIEFVGKASDAGEEIKGTKGSSELAQVTIS